MRLIEPSRFDRSTQDPIRILSIALVVTVLALIAGLWSAYDPYQRFSITVQRNTRIEELRGRIVFLDEVLTMSARMSAATGDPDWEDRYRRSETQLGQAILEATAMVVGTRTATLTDQAGSSSSSSSSSSEAGSAD